MRISPEHLTSAEGGVLLRMVVVEPRWKSLEASARDLAGILGAGATKDRGDVSEVGGAACAAAGGGAACVAAACVAAGVAAGERHVAAARAAAGVAEACVAVAGGAACTAAGGVACAAAACAAAGGAVMNGSEAAHRRSDVSPQARRGRRTAASVETTTVPSAATRAGNTEIPRFGSSSPRPSPSA